MTINDSFGKRGKQNSLSHTYTHTHVSGWNDNSLRLLVVVLFFVAVIYLLIYHFEQESRIRRQNIVKMHLYEEH